MKVYSLIELSLLVAAFFAVLKIDATATKLWLTVPCLLVVLTIERVRKRQADERTASERLKNFSSAELRKKMNAEHEQRHYRS